MHFSNIWGHTDLTNSIIKEDWSAVKTHCELHPRDAKVWTKRVGFFDGEHESQVLPIHQAVALYAPRDVIERIATTYPEGVRSKETAFKRLPVHIACQSGASADVVSALLSFYPEGAQVKDTLGRLPIHYACSNGASAEVVEALLAAYLWAAAAQDIHSWLPIHVACHFGASTEVVRALLNAFPDSIQARTEKGSTPLKLIQKINCKNKEEILSLLEDEAWKHWHGPMKDHSSTFHSSAGTDFTIEEEGQLLRQHNLAIDLNSGAAM
eukprot:CAMPEP_0183320058 /NCGR_PEP_ID=MMETSP0160_2-20130417/65282_1 /TAXON_ID=2839 ORGANISM="Odontella Sinensis, Strain Grunow 1884" /NCGR_SAMPLE_ID=MMETSP0160_2 /ASSEMBLY_ACC=CAM_ASM_000250 /LENGTH=266 /DNA_ID=CAMNT_0025486667 /DNA_START=157 /DNA_END=955 /DNA_ORIENTATION=-